VNRGTGKVRQKKEKEENAANGLKEKRKHGHINGGLLAHKRGWANKKENVGIKKIV